jgi:hypothetical protein
MQNHYFDPNHPLREYLFSVPAAPGSAPPPDCLRVEPEKRDGQWPGEKDGVWTYFESHKGKKGWLNGVPHTITEHGPLPEGWSDEPPPPTDEEISAARVAEIKARLDAIDLALIRGLDARDEGTATAEDEARLTELRAEKRTLRAELKELEGSNG